MKQRLQKKKIISETVINIFKEIKDIVSPKSWNSILLKFFKKKKKFKTKTTKSNSPEITNDSKNLKTKLGLKD